MYIHETAIMKLIDNIMLVPVQLISENKANAQCLCEERSDMIILNGIALSKILPRMESWPLSLVGSIVEANPLGIASDCFAGLCNASQRQPWGTLPGSPTLRLPFLYSLWFKLIYIFSFFYYNKMFVLSLSNKQFQEVLWTNESF